MQTLSELYAKRVSSGALSRDPAQEAAVLQLDRFIERYSIRPKRGLFRKVNSGSVKGVYLYGSVGRGKTMLMDLLVETLDDPGVRPTVRRVHFHAFMLEIHARLKAVRDTGATDDVLGQVAEAIAQNTKLLCFDELHVNDIADAMILGPLFKGLMEQGVTIVATSNYRPDDLYKDGLQRARFLPFIDFLKQHVEVVYLDSPTDYRLRALSERGTWFYPLTDQSWEGMHALFETLTDHVPAPATSIDIDGRSLPILNAGARSAWLTFDILCRENRGASDYIALGHAFENIFLDGVPRLEEHNRNEARRFMTLVDTLYDQRRVLVVRAATRPDHLYDGTTHNFEFQRTVSRLLEMQSPEWLNGSG